MRTPSVVAASLLLFSVFGCEKARGAKSTEDELKELVIKYYTAATFDDWSACWNEESAEMFSRAAWEKGPRPAVKREDIKVTKIEITGDAAIIHCEPSRRTRIMPRLWAEKKHGKWLLAFYARAPLHRSRLGAAREHARKARCGSNLRQIAYACRLFSTDNEEKLPATLQALFPEHMSDRKVFSCPSAGKARGTRSAENELKGLVIKYYTAATFDDWSACMDEKSAKMFGRAAWEKSKRPAMKREDIRITTVEITRDAAVVHCESPTGKKDVMRSLRAVKEGRRWLLTFTKARAPTHESRMEVIREKVNKATCGSNLRELVYACERFSRDNEEKFPPTLEALFPKHMSYRRIFSCPSKRGEMDYTYVVGLNSRGPPDCVLAYDKEGNHEGGRNVLFLGRKAKWGLDGKVEWMTERDFKKALEKTREYMKSGTSVPATKPSKRSEMDYTCVAGLKPGDPPDSVLAYDKDGNHEGGRNVVFLDGKARWMTEEEFKRALEKTRMHIKAGGSTTR